MPTAIDPTDTMNPQVLEAMLQMSDRAPEPGTWHTKDVLHRADAEVPAPMVASALESAGYTYVYNTRTGDRSLVNNNMLPAQLRKRLDDGTRAFSLQPPAGVTPVHGAFRCALHPEQRALEAEALGFAANRFDTMGLPTCPKANLTSEFEVSQHMQHRHKREWAAIEDMRARKEREEARAAQQALLSIAGERAAAQKGKG